MANIEQETFVCLDCETTGLDPVNDQIVEVAAIRFTFNEVLDEFESIINPQCVISETSIAFHHITSDMVVGKPTIEVVLPRILEILGDHIIVGHSIEFDIQLLINAAQKYGIPCQLKNNRFLDTLRMARRYGDCPTNSLEQLRRHFNIPQEGAHRAMSDVIVNAAVFKRLAAFYKSSNEIFQALAKPIMFKLMPLGKHKGRLLSEIPLQYLLWAARQDYDQDLLYTLRSEINRRKKGNLFSQASNPFSQL